VNGRNTKDCLAYPGKVQRHVEASAQQSCSGRAFQDCVALVGGRGTGHGAPPMPAPALASTLPAISSDRAHDATRTAPFTSRLGHWLNGASGRIGD